MNEKTKFFMLKTATDGKREKWRDKIGHVVILAICHKRDAQSLYSVYYARV